MTRSQNFAIVPRILILIICVSIVCILLSQQQVQGEKEPVWNASLNSGLTKVSMSRDGAYSLVATGNEISLFDNDNGEPVWSDSLPSPVSDIDISSSGSVIAVGTQERLLVYQGPDMQLLWGQNFSQGVDMVVLSDSGSYLSSLNGSQISYFSSQNSVPIWQHNFSSPVSHITIDANGDTIVLGFSNETASLHDRNGSNPIRTFPTIGHVNVVDISDDGVHFVVGTANDTIHLFHRDENESLMNYSLDGPVTKIELSADGSKIVSVSADSILSLFSSAEEDPLWTFSTPGSITSVAFSNDGQYIAIGSDDSRIRFFNGNSNSPLWFAKPNFTTIDLAISRDGYHVFAGSTDGASDTELLLFAKVMAIIDDISPNPALRNYEVEFRGNGTTDEGQIVRYLWWSDIEGELYNGSNDRWEMAYLDPGVHTITLKVMNGQGFWSHSVTTDLVIGIKPVAVNELMNPNPAQDTYRIFFQANSTEGLSNLTEYSWRSNINGEFYLGENSTFYYSQLDPGEHIIYLKVRSNLGFWSDEITSALVINDRPEVSILSITPNPAGIGESIYFRSNAYDENNVIPNYVWTSDIDGEFYNGSEPDIYFSSLSLGQHAITLQVVDSAGFWSLKALGEVTVAPKPVALIDSISPSYIFVGQNVSFSALAVVDGSVETYRWTSDIDGLTYEGPLAKINVTGFSHGIHTITLMVMDDSGIWSEGVDETINVVPIPFFKSTYVGGGNILLEWTMEIESTPGARVNGNTINLVNVSSQMNHSIIIPVDIGNNSFYLDFELPDGKTFSSPKFYVDHEKTGIFENQPREIILKKNEYRVVVIAARDEDNKVSGPADDDATYELMFTASNPVDVLFMDENNYREYRSALNTGSEEAIDYYVTGSILSTTGGSLVVTLVKSDIFYFVFDNTQHPEAGTSSSTSITIQHSLFLVEAPLDSPDRDPTRETFTIMGGGDGGDSGTSIIGILFIILIVIFIAFAGLLLGLNQGYISESQLPPFLVKLTGKSQSDDGWPDSSDADDDSLADDDDSTEEDDYPEEEQEWEGDDEDGQDGTDQEDDEADQDDEDYD